MRISQVLIRNFRRLEHVTIDIEDRETVFVGPNNSGKTSATAIFRCFLGNRDFKVYDFSVGRIDDLNKFPVSRDLSKLPSIELDIWFTVDPNTVAFGRASMLLTNLSEDLTELGMRLSFGFSDPETMLKQYETSTQMANGNHSKTLTQFLATAGSLKSYCQTSYFSLNREESTVVSTPLSRENGKKFAQDLIRVDFVDAQRNINDDDSSRSNRLSTAFASFYRKNLEQPEVAEAAHKVIDENNASLTSHYKVQFEPLISLIKELGVPSVNDRELRLISSLSPETALGGNTELLYVDTERDHELPEMYNGLGFKNLIYMAIQVRHFHAQWMGTPVNRPLCQLIFIEEPEVHLHAQVQQTFINNIWQVMGYSVDSSKTPALAPQLLITTHSSHVLETVKFSSVRYFCRCSTDGDTPHSGILNASNVCSLRSFKPQAEIINEKHISSEETLNFLQQYVKLTHCDLFFADGAILIEGASEKLLLPMMIRKTAKGLLASYVTILEIGGAHIHMFEGLLSFLCIPYLVITDLDSVEPTGHHQACRADFAGALTANATLKKFCKKATVDDLMAVKPEDKKNALKDRCIAFQYDITVTEGTATRKFRPRTFEEAIAYQNFALLRSNVIPLGTSISTNLDSAYGDIYSRIHSPSFKKTDFAMTLLGLTEDWQTPNYIVSGLQWLESRLSKRASQ